MAILEGGVGDQTLLGVDDEENEIFGEFFSFIGIGGNDTIAGGANAPNFLYGEGRFVGISGSTTVGGDDTITGGSGFSAENFIYGDAFSAQSITGGDDRLVSGENATDNMYGDWEIEGPFDSIEGNDTFSFEPNNGNDFIFDFQQGLDKIELQNFVVKKPKEFQYHTNKKDDHFHDPDCHADNCKIETDSCEKYRSPKKERPLDFELLQIDEVDGDSVIRLDDQNTITVVDVVGLTESDFLFVA